MSTKDCPSCGTTVPSSASRCKECFHDFAASKGKRSLVAPLLILGAVAAMSVVAALTLLWVSSGPVDQRILVDGDSQAIVWMRQYADGVESERLPFDQVGKLEYVIKGGGGGFEVVAVTVTGERHVLADEMQPLGSMAESYARIMDKPLEQIDHSGGKAVAGH